MSKGNRLTFWILVAMALGIIAGYLVHENASADFISKFAGNIKLLTTIFLHLVQMIRDESHRFAVTFHRKRRQIRDRASELLEIPGIGALTTRRLVEHFGSVRAVKEAEQAALSAVVTPAQAAAILDHFRTGTENTKVTKENR